MAVEIVRGQDGAELVARVALARRKVLLGVHRRRLRWEDLEDCYSQATLELVTRAKDGGGFDSVEHIANALEQKFVSRINDRRRAMGGRSAAETALASAVSVEDEDSGLVDLADRRPPVADQVIHRHELARLREVADDLTPDQRLVLACQVGLGMGSAAFCARYGWHSEKYRKVAQRARAKLRVLVVDYQSGERCRQFEPAIVAVAAGVAAESEHARVQAHVTNCLGCARSLRELERAGREVAAVLPSAGIASATAGAGLVHRLLRLLPGSHGAPLAAGATAAAGGGGAALGAGSSVFGAGALKLGIAALCVAGVAGGYAVCARSGLVPGVGDAAAPPRVHRPPRLARRVTVERLPAVPRLGTVVSGPQAPRSSSRGPARHRHPAGRRTRLVVGGAAARQAGREFGHSGAGATGAHRDALAAAGPATGAPSFEAQGQAQRPKAASSSIGAARNATGEFGGFAG